MKKLNIQLAMLVVALMFAWGGVQAQDTVVVCPGNDFKIGLDNSNSSTQWQKSTDGVSFSDIANATGDTLTVSPVTDDAWYRATTDLDGGCEVISDTIYVVQSQLTADAGVGGQVCPNSDVTLGGSPTGSGGEGTLTYSWSNGATDENPVVSFATATTFSVTVTDALGCTATSEVAYDVLTVSSGSQTFDVGGAPVSFGFPQCVDTLMVTLMGAEGVQGEDFNNQNTQGQPGLGGMVTGMLLRDPNLSNPDSILIYVGLQNGWNGGAAGGTSSNNPGGNGGGASDIRYGGNALSNRVAVAGGGGGGGGGSHGSLSILTAGDGGAGGAATAGQTGQGYPSSNQAPQGGSAGDQAAGGLGGNGGPSASIGCSDGLDGQNGVSADGGVGGNGGATAGSCPEQGAGGGGGGGGYFGGGGAGGGQGLNSNSSFPGGGGGGGSSFTGGLINGSATPGVRSGDGEITISW